VTAVIVDETDWLEHVGPAFVSRYVRERQGQTFSANDLWAAGLPHPPDRRRLNTVLGELARKGLIERTAVKVPSHRGNSHPIRLWRAVGSE